MEEVFKEGVSIITIVLNGESFIEETIQSVIQQEDVDYEYIIIDGGSTDGTLEKIAPYNRYVKFLVSESDGGIYQAINKGISFASYQLIGLLNCGDCYTSNALSDAYNVFKKYGADVVYGDIEIKEEIDNVFYTKRLIANHKLLITGMSIYHPSTFIKLEIYREMGTYDFIYRSAADYDLLLRLFLQDRYFVHVPQVLAIFRSGGLSSRNFRLSLKENYLIRLRRLGQLNAIQFLIYRISNYLYFNTRKIFIQAIIGRKMYQKLKKRKHK